MIIVLFDKIGSFAENKDIARDLRVNEIIPALEKKEEIIIDFKGVDSVTQSFIHALISDLIRQESLKVLDKVFFKNCNEKIKKIISIVVDYMQESL